MWEKITVKARTSEDIESITAVLISCGIVGMEIIDHAERVRDLNNLISAWDYADESLLEPSTEKNIVFYIAKEDGCEEQERKIKSELKKVDCFEIIRECEYDCQWLNEWKKYFKPIKIGNVTIVPEWEKYEPKKNETIFRIDPGAAFGTGQHESTKLSILALQEYVKNDDVMLDIGCGSGILSCIGKMLGAKKVIACDIDPIGAVRATKKNIALNGLSNIEVFSGDVFSSSKICEETYDVVVANIVADVIIELLPLVNKLLKKGGLFISSGIIGDRAEEVKDAFRKTSLNIIWQKEINNWLAYVVEKNA